MSTAHATSSSSHLIPNHGSHTPWDPITMKDALAEDVLKATAYLLNTAWLRGMRMKKSSGGGDGGGGQNVLFSYGDSGRKEVFSQRDPFIKGKAELNVLEQTDVLYTSMLKRLLISTGGEEATATLIQAAFADALKASLTSVVDPRLGNDSDALLAYIALTIRGVREWLLTNLHADSASTVVTNIVDALVAVSVSSTSGFCDAKTINSLLEELDAMALSKASASVSGSSPSAFRRIAASLAAPFLTSSDSDDKTNSAAALVSSGMLIGAFYFAPLMKVFPSFFIRWLAAVESLLGCALDILLPIAVGALVRIPQRGSTSIPVSHPSHLLQSTQIGLLLGTLVDGGSVQAEGPSPSAPSPAAGPPSSSSALLACREAFTAAVARAALSSFVEGIFVAGPLQWAKQTALTCLLDSHPLTTSRGNSTLVHQHHHHDGGAQQKRRRVESGGVGGSVGATCVASAAFPLSATVAWDTLAGSVFPLFLSQGGYEFPWHRIEQSVRSALAPSGNAAMDGKGTASWAPTASARLARRKASTIVDDTFAILAKELVETSFPSRIAALTLSVPNSATNGVCLQSLCLAIDKYQRACESAAKAHQQLFSAVAKRQSQRLAKDGSSASSSSSKVFEDIDGLMKERLITLPTELGLSTLYSTPAVFTMPILFAVLSLFGISHTAASALAAASAPHGGGTPRGRAFKSSGVVLPSSGNVPTTVDVADLFEMLQIKVDLMPSTTELKATASMGNHLVITPQFVSIIRARITLTVLLMGMVRLSQLAHRDAIHYWLTRRGLLETVQQLGAEASTSTAVSAEATAQVLDSLRTPLPSSAFNFSKYLAVSGSSSSLSDGAVKWVDAVLQHSQGYTPLSALMEGLFGGAGGALPPPSLTENTLVSAAALTLEAFAKTMLLGITTIELEGTAHLSSSSAEGGAGSLKPICSPSIDVFAWCMLFSATLGLSVGGGGANGDATGFQSRFPFALQSAMKGNVSGGGGGGDASPYVAISPHLNPIVIDHPTRGYAIRKLLWSVSEVLARGLLKARSLGQSADPTARHVMVEANKFVQSLEAFGILEWSTFGASWRARFGEVFML